jgi:two-component system phosphate regulon sensor histidine kinase PhoR|tara:strand:- start:1009 stop:2778 length:1770 start_codon:yes stop_codon:yes gene_type:complete
MKKLLPNKIFSRIFTTNLFIISVVVILFLWLFNFYFTSFYYLEKESDLESRAILFSELLGTYTDFRDVDLSLICKELKQDTKTRYTVINKNGSVLGDSDENPKSMDNHLSRPEVLDANNGKIGTSIRYSNTVKEKMLYLAILQNINGEQIIIRTSVPLNSLKSNISLLTSEIIKSSIYILIATLGISLFISRKIANPLEKMVVNAMAFSKGEFQSRIKPSNTIEINSLAKSLNIMATQLDERIKLITLQKNENDAILASMAEGLVAVDYSNKIIKTNDFFRDLFELKGRAVGLDINNVIIDKKFLKFYKDLTNHKNIDNKEVTIDNIKNKTILCSATMLKDQEDNFIGHVIVVNDITKLRNLEKVRQEFVANVSHELKTPITALKGYVETLKDVDNDEDKNYFLNILDKQTSRMNSIINDLLELSRLEESVDKGDIEIFENNILDLINDAINECEYAANKKQIKLHINCSSSIIFNLNKRLIQESVVNLIYNAIRYSDNEKIVKVDVKIISNNLHISVKDKGIGIPKNELDHIFKRFYCVDKSHSKATGGTGLGLSIVKHIMNLHSGKVVVESNVGEGSNFTLIIPKKV